MGIADVQEHDRQQRRTDERRPRRRQPPRRRVQYRNCRRPEQRREHARRQVQDGRIGERLRHECRLARRGAGNTLYREQRRKRRGDHVDEESRIQKEMRIGIALKNAERGADEFLFVRPREVVRQTKPQAPHSQRESAGNQEPQ